MEEQRTLEAIERLKEQTQRLELLSEQVDSKIAQADGSYIQQLSGLEHQLQLKDEHVHQLSRDLAQLRHWQQLIADKDSTDDDEDNLLSDKEERIEELEEALRESVRITADREMALHAETQLRMQISEKVARLEQRLQSLQNAQSLKCSQCQPNRQRLHESKTRLDQLLAERRSHLHELFDMKQEALEAAISERDAQLALLEVSGIKTARVAEQADDLKADRKRLMELMKHQNERRVELLHEYEQRLPEN